MPSRSRSSDIEDHNKHLSIEKIEEKIAKKLRKLEKLEKLRSKAIKSSKTDRHDKSELTAFRKHCRQHDDEASSSSSRHRHRHGTKKPKDLIPSCRRSHCRKIKYEHDIELRHIQNNRMSSKRDERQKSTSTKRESIETESYTPKVPRPSSTITVNENECLIGEILHNIISGEQHQQDDELEVTKTPEISPQKSPQSSQIAIADDIPLPDEPSNSSEVAEEPKIQPEIDIKLPPLEERQEPVKFHFKAHKVSVLDLPMPPPVDPMPQKHKKSHRHSKSKHSSHPIDHSDGPKTPPEPEVPAKVPRPRPSVIRDQPIAHKELEIRSINSYNKGPLVGKGTYGEVYKAEDLLTKSTVALKYVKMERENEGIPITTVREINVLRSLDNPNIVQLNAIVCSDHKRNFLTYLSFEYMNHDLLAILHNEKYKFSEDFIFIIFKQILEGVNYCHNRNIIHRDLKCSNILLNSKGEVKVADFGLSREYVENRPFTNKVSSLWYRAIELLLGQEKYNTMIDMWSLGCIFGELFRKQAIFHHCSTEFDIVPAIFKLCGIPHSKSWPEAKLLPHYSSFVNSNTKRSIRSVRDHFIGLIPPLALDLLDKMLCLNPSLRITAAEALQSNWITVMSLKNIKVPLEVLNSGDCHELMCRKK